MEVSRRVGQWARRIGKALVPDALFLPGMPRPAPVEIRVTALPLDENARLAARQARRPVVALLDPALTLRRRVDLPKAVGAKAEAAIGLQLRQTLPGQAQGLVWRAVPIARAGATTEHAVYILKQTQLDALLAELRAFGAKIEAVTIAAPGLQPVWQNSPDKAQTVRNWQAFAALAVAVVSLASVLGLERDRGTLADLVGTRIARIAALEERLLAKRAETDRGKEKASAILTDMGRFTAQSRRLQLLADLTATLPDAVWVSELSISGDQLVLSGFASGEVTEVISLIQALPWAKDVQLNGTISFDSYSGQNRFELGMRIAGGNPT